MDGTIDIYGLVDVFDVQVYSLILCAIHVLKVDPLKPQLWAGEQVVAE